MRLAAVLGGWAWTTVNPDLASAGKLRAALGMLLLAFVIYSLALIAGILYRPAAALKWYRASSALDLFFVSALVYLTGGLDSDFYLAFYVLIGLHTFYYSSMKTGLVTAASSGALYVAAAALVSWPEALTSWYVLALRVIFFFLVALPSGVAADELARHAGRLREYSERVVELNQRLDERLAQTNLLYQATERLLEGRAQDDPLEALVAIGTKALEAEAGALYRSDVGDLSGYGKLLLRAASGEYAVDWPEAIGAESDHIVAKAYRADSGPILERSPLQTDVVASPVMGGTADSRGGGRKRGVIVYRRRDQVFSDEDVRVVEALTGLAASLIVKSPKYSDDEIPTAGSRGFLDSGTGLYNREYFLSRVAGEMSRAAARRRTLALAVLSLGGGREAALIQALRINVRGPDVVSGIGPGEFGVLLPETDEAAAVELLEQALQAYAILLTMPAAAEGEPAPPERKRSEVRLGFTFYPPPAGSVARAASGNAAELVAEARANQRAAKLALPVRSVGPGGRKQTPTAL